jgi:hypothetical protein
MIFTGEDTAYKMQDKKANNDRQKRKLYMTDNIDPEKLEWSLY